MVEWKKVLYNAQAFPDTYTPPSFLDDVVLNAHVKERHYWKVVKSSGTLLQQISTVCISVCVSIHLYRESIGFGLMSSICIAVLIVGFALCGLIGGHILGGSIYRAARQGILLTLGVFFFSPLLQTLTESVSSDSIVALVCILLLIHLYFHDYKFINSVTDKFTGSVSLGCAVFSSVLISSRMHSILYVFVQNLFSMELYLLCPFARRYILQSSERLYQITTFVFVCTSAGLCVSLSVAVSVIYCLSLIFVSLVCPLFLVRMHKFKSKINGPWDEAVPRIPLRLMHIYD